MQGLDLPAGVYSLVICVDVDVKQLAMLGKDFPWKKPSRCPRCQSALWWHGFVLAYFSCLNDGVYLKRLRCPTCRSVHRIRPHGYWKYFQSTIKSIFETIRQKINQNRWRPDLPRSRQRQWLRRLKRQVVAVLGMQYTGSLADGFSELLELGFTPVSSVIQSART